MGRPHDRYCCHLGSPRFERSPVLSSSYRNRLARPKEAPPPPPAMLVSGTLNPDITGLYNAIGTYNGKPTYKNEDLTRFIWYTPDPDPDIHFWWITNQPGNYHAEIWYKYTATQTPATGDYAPYAGATGTATVSEA